MTDTDRLAALLHEIDCVPNGLVAHAAGVGSCGTLAARLTAAGVRVGDDDVPTEAQLELVRSYQRGIAELRRENDRLRVGDEYAAHVQDVHNAMCQCGRYEAGVRVGDDGPQCPWLDAGGDERCVQREGHPPPHIFPWHRCVGDDGLRAALGALAAEWERRATNDTPRYALQWRRCAEDLRAALAASPAPRYATEPLTDGEGRTLRTLTDALDIALASPAPTLDRERLARALFETQAERLHGGTDGLGLGSHEADAAAIADAYEAEP